MPLAAHAGDTIAAILQRPALDAQERRILLAHALGLSRIQLITSDQTTLDAAQAEQVSQLFARRLQGEPIAYLTGTREFYGLALEVSPAVLIPRPDTELLVELAIDRLPQRATLLDLGTGSGAIAIAIAATRSDTTVTATDCSDAAVAVARRNAQRHAVKVNMLRSDWFAAIPAQRFDLIVANPPYIVAGDPHLMQGDLRFEPIDALTDHADGFSAVRTIIADAPRFLVHDGWLLLEHGYDQAAGVRDLLGAARFSEVQSWTDLSGIERVSGGRCCAID